MQKTSRKATNTKTYRTSFSDSEPFEVRTSRHVTVAWRWLATHPTQNRWAQGQGAATDRRHARKAMDDSMRSRMPRGYELVSEEVVKLYRPAP